MANHIFMEKFYVDKCRICGSKIKPFLNLGGTHPPEEFRKKSELKKPIKTVPLGLAYCSKCGEVQLSHEMPADMMYKDNYFYDYSITKTGEKHWTEIAKLLYKKYHLSKSDFVVDIGSNTGKLLSIFKRFGVGILGIDPADKQVRIARQRGIPTINAYFTNAVAKNVVKKYGKAHVITCTNVFDHVPDLYDFTRGVATLMKSDGVFIIEVPYFATFYKTLGHVVYHQQIDYLLVGPFTKLFNACGLQIIDCQKIPMHGGSIRIFVAFKGKYDVSPHVGQFIREENALFKNREKALKSFASKVLKQRDDLKNLLKRLKKQGKSIGAVGASAKGNTLLYYSRLGPETIDFITEKSSLKVGRYTPLGVPVVKDEVLIKEKPDYAVLLAWNFTKEIANNLKGYTKSGGKFIVPIPRIKIMK
jgi:SAM-dependent methyltransferase